MAGIHRSMLGAICVLVCIPTCLGQLSAPHVDDAHLGTDNKFRAREASADTGTPKRDEEVVTDNCGVNLDIKWFTEVSSSVYATPIITDLYSDGQKDVIVPSFVHYLEALEGDDGAQATGWPVFHKSTLHSSPMMYDWDFNGVPDILMATYNGEVLAFSDLGMPLKQKILIPRLSVKKDWYVGLSLDHVDRTHPDVGAQEQTQQSSQLNFKEASLEHKKEDATINAQPTQNNAQTGQQTTPERPQGVNQESSTADPVQNTPLSNPRDSTQQNRPLSNPGDAAQGSSTAQQAGVIGQQQDLPRDGSNQWQENQGQTGQQQPQNQGFTGQQQTQNQELTGQQQNQGVTGQQQGQNQGITGQLQGQNQGVTGEQRQQSGDGGSFNNPPPMQRQQVGGERQYGSLQRRRLMEDVQPRDANLKPEGVLSDEAEESFHELFEEDNDRAFDFESKHYDEWDKAEGLTHGGPPDSVMKDYYDYSDYDKLGEDKEEWWGDEGFEEPAHKFESGMVDIDAHVLCTPVIADLDNDGQDEMIIAVSYFFDREYYDDPMHAHEIAGINIEKYVAGAILVYDVSSREMKWKQHLDLSTDQTKYRAYIYSSPTVADVDGDGYLEIIVGTSMGFLYMLDHRGGTVEGWPLQLGEVQAQPVVADVNDDGRLEVIVVDLKGNIAVFNSKGAEVWERHVGSMMTQMPTLGDVNGDGELDVVVGSVSGQIFAMTASNGQDLPHFPFKTGGMVMSPVMITKLGDGRPGQHLVSMAFDGYLYVVDAAAGCADSMDIGESSYSMVLTDDLDGNGYMDLLIATMNGNIYAIQTSALYQPLKTWTSQTHGLNTYMSRYDMEGVYATKSTRAARDVRGQKMQVKFEIIDKRPAVLPQYIRGRKGGGQSAPVRGSDKKAAVAGRGPYKVSVMLKGVGVDAMNAGDHPVVGISDTFDAPGTYTVEIPCPRTTTTATISIDMYDEMKQHFHDEFSLSFHIHFYKLLKWLVALPFTIMAILILSVRNLSKLDKLPSYMR